MEITAELIGGEVCVSVKDPGEGVPAEEIPRIWDRLYGGIRVARNGDWDWG